MILEQDAAYWEVQVELPSGSAEIMAGVATDKDRKFFTALEAAESK